MSRAHEVPEGQLLFVREREELYLRVPNGFRRVRVSSLSWAAWRLAALQWWSEAGFRLTSWDVVGCGVEARKPDGALEDPDSNAHSAPVLWLLDRLAGSLMAKVEGGEFLLTCMESLLGGNHHINSSRDKDE